MSKGTILITGAAGFIGSHVTRDLLRFYGNGYRIIAVDNLSGGFIENLPEGAEFVCADVSDQQIVNAIFKTFKPQFVFHLAAYAAEGLSFFIQNFNIRNNLISSVNLINASVNHKVERFVFTSSIAVYGHAKPPVDEACPTLPADPYGIAKSAVEQSLRVAGEMFGLQYTIFRPHNVFGEYQNLGDPYRNVVGIFMNQMLRNQPLTVFGDGNQRRAFSYIAGVSWAIAPSRLSELPTRHITWAQTNTIRLANWLNKSSAPLEKEPRSSTYLLATKSEIFTPSTTKHFPSSPTPPRLTLARASRGWRVGP